MPVSYEHDGEVVGGFGREDRRHTEMSEGQPQDRVDSLPLGWDRHKRPTHTATRGASLYLVY